MVTLFKSGDLIRQRVFRKILEAVSRPGGIVHLPAAEHRRDRSYYLLLVLETLLDQETSHCLIEGECSMELDQALHQLTRSPRAALEEADFIIAPRGRTGENLVRAKRGRPEYPDLSATVVYLVHSLSDDPGAAGPGSLQGPGIEDQRAIPVMEGFDIREFLQLCLINQEFPLGIDALFVDPAGRLAAIPRSTEILLTRHAPPSGAWHHDPLDFVEL